MESTSAAKAGWTLATLSQRRRRCATQRQISTACRFGNELEWLRKKPDARAIFKAATHFSDPKVLLEVSEDLQRAMKGLAIAGMDEAQMLQTRGW